MSPAIEIEKHKSIMLAAGARRVACCLGGRGAAPFGVGLSRSLVPSGLRSMCEKGSGDSKGKEGEGAAAGGEAAPAGGAAAGTAQRVPRTMAFSKTGGGWNQGSLAARSASLRPQAPMGGSRDWAQRPVGGMGAPEPVEYDKELLKKLGISHVPAWRIASILRDEDTTLEDMAQLVEQEFHLGPDEEEDDYYGYGTSSWGAGRRGGRAPANPDEEPEYDPNVWGPDKVTQLLPRRRFFPGQTYEPHELSPKTKVDWGKIRNTFTPKSCPLGGRKGPKVDWTNVTLLQRFLTDGGNIKPRRVTKVCAKKQRELARSIRRARTMCLIARTKKGVPAYYGGEQRAGGYNKAGAVYDRD